MTQQPVDIRVDAERMISAPADLVYRLIADYRQHHPAFLPPAFSNLTVEQGGVGDGTVISFNLNVGGRTRRMRASISEPEPGRVLRETDLDTGGVTTFTVSPDRDETRVAIRTEFASAGGLQGWIERRFAPGMLRKLYAQELERLDAYAHELAGIAADVQ